MAECSATLDPVLRLVAFKSPRPSGRFLNVARDRFRGSGYRPVELMGNVANHSAGNEWRRTLYGRYLHADHLHVAWVGFGEHCSTLSVRDA